MKNTKFTNPNIANTFIGSADFKLFLRGYYNTYGIKIWKDFIKSKDLGITVVNVNSEHNFTYKIIDEKKWLFTKLKYSW